MADIRTTSSHRPARTRALLGGLIVVLGVLLLVDSTGLLAVDGFELFLAGALVVYGGYRLVTERARNLLWPGVALLVGSGWLAVEAGLLTGAQARQLWPLLVVLFGLSLLRTRRAGIVALSTGGSGESGVTAVFEDARLDLRGVDLPPASRVDAVAVFDDAEVVVPEGWVVLVEATTVFGRVEDLRRSRPTGEPDLLIDGVALFGDIRLTD
jgi:hypothetical protein